MSDRLAQHYIRAYGLHAVYVGSTGMPGTSAAIIGRSRNIGATLRWLRSQHGPRVRIVGHWWCASERQAQRVVNASEGQTRTALEMCEILPEISAELGLAIADGQVVHARALEAVNAVKERLASMKATGELQPVNRSYRMLREKRAASGLKTMPYPVFLRRYSVGLLYKMAAEVRSITEREKLRR